MNGKMDQISSVQPLSETVPIVQTNPSDGGGDQGVSGQSQPPEAMLRKKTRRKLRKLMEKQKLSLINKAKRKMAIINTGHPQIRLEDEDIDIVRDSFIGITNKVVGPIIPRCTFMNIVAGVIFIMCDGPEAVALLKQLEGIYVKSKVLKVIEDADLIRPVKMSFHSKTTAPLANEKVLELLERQNTDLDTGYWIVLETQIEGRQATRFVGMDYPSANYIRSQNYKLQCLWDECTFRLIEDKETNEEATWRGADVEYENARPARKKHWHLQQLGTPAKKSKTN